MTLLLSISTAGSSSKRASSKWSNEKTENPLHREYLRTRFHNCILTFTTSVDGNCLRARIFPVQMKPLACHNQILMSSACLNLSGILLGYRQCGFDRASQDVGSQGTPKTHENTTDAEISSAFHHVAMCLMMPIMFFLLLALDLLKKP